MTALEGWLHRAVPATAKERSVALWAFAYFFALLAGYYLLRPLRDQMGIAGGVKNLPWLFTATFLSLLVAQPLYGAMVARLPRRQVYPDRLPLLCRQPGPVLGVADARRGKSDRRTRIFCLAQRIQFVCGGGVLVVHGRSLYRPARQAAVRVHWGWRHRRSAPRSCRHDRALEAARSGQFVDRGRGSSLKWLYSASIELSTWPRLRQHWILERQPVGGGAIAALPELIRSPYLLGVAAWVSLLSFGATIAYFAQANIVSATIHDATTQTRLFAGIDLAVGLLSLATQVFATAKFLKRFGTGISAATLPAVY